MSRSGDNKISENKFFMNKWGIFSRGLNNTIIMNEVNKNVFGIVLYSDFTQNNFIIDNDIYNNQYGIISTSTKNNFFNKNTINDNSNTGMILENSSNNSVYNNYLNNNAFGGIVLNQGSYNNTILNNHFYEIGIKDDNENLNIYCINDTENNYFDGATGPECVCVSNLVNTTWSNWTNLTCLSNNLMNQSRYLIQYDSNSCPNSTNRTIYEYRAILPCPPPTISFLSINSPSPGVYNNGRLNINLNSNIILSKIDFIDYSEKRPRPTNLCKNCNNYNKMTSSPP